MSISDGGDTIEFIFFSFFFYTNPDSPGRKVNSFASCDENCTAHDFIFQRRKVFCIIYFAATSFPPCVALFRPPPPNVVAIPLLSTLLVTNHAPFFSNPSFRILFVSVNVAKLLRSIVLPFHSFSNSFLGILYKVVPNKSCRQCGWMDSLFFWLKKKGRRKREKGKLFDFGILKIKLICRFMKLAS